MNYMRSVTQDWLFDRKNQQFYEFFPISKNSDDFRILICVYQIRLDYYSKFWLWFQMSLEMVIDFWNYKLLNQNYDCKSAVSNSSPQWLVLVLILFRFGTSNSRNCQHVHFASFYTKYCHNQDSRLYNNLAYGP